MIQLLMYHVMFLGFEPKIVLVLLRLAVIAAPASINRI